MPVTRIDVAKRAKVSPSTVSRVLNNNGYVATEARQRVLKAIKDLNYVPNRAARSLRLQKYRQIACIGPVGGNLFYNEIVSGIEDSALEAGYTLSWYHLTRERIDDIQVILNGFYDGIIFLAPYDIDDILDLNDIASRYPVCIYEDRGKTYSASHVYVDLRVGMRQSVEYLISLGHQKILFMGYEFENPEENPRYQGYVDALKKHHIELDKELIQLIPNHKDTISYGHSLIQSAIERKVFFSAVVASNDSMAVGALRGLREGELEVPKQVSVVGMDNIELANLVTPALTTTHIPKQEIGNHLMELLLQQIDHNNLAVKQVELPTQLVIRESTGPNLGQGSLPSGAAPGNSSHTVSDLN